MTDAAQTARSALVEAVAEVLRDLQVEMWNLIGQPVFDRNEYAEKALAVVESARALCNTCGGTSEVHQQYRDQCPDRSDGQGELLVLLALGGECMVTDEYWDHIVETWRFPVGTATSDGNYPSSGRMESVYPSEVRVAADKEAHE